MNLILDIGNTLSKVAVFNDNNIVFMDKYENLSVDDIRKVIDDYPEIDCAIVSSVADYDVRIDAFLEQKYGLGYIKFTHSTRMSIKNGYATPETLGVDRLAAAEGALSLYGARAVILVVDFGSAVTIDLVEKGVFKGGNISLGARLRFKALNDYTAKLPLCDITDNYSLIGTTTKEAIENGVINSIIFETEGYINRINEKYDDLKIIFTGGDAKYFANKLKNTIFAYSELVLFGLNEVLRINRF